MIHIESSNIEIIMLKKHMEDRSNTNEKEIQNMKNNLNKAMRKLSGNERKVIRMYFHEDKKENEIAEILDMHQPNVNRLKRSGIKKLKTILRA